MSDNEKNIIACQWPWQDVVSCMPRPSYLLGRRFAP